MLEVRFDNIVSRAGVVPSRKQSRQLIMHGHFLINGKPVDIPSYGLKPGDEITVKTKSQKLIREIMESSQILATEPRWLSVDKNDLKVIVQALPEREDLDPNIKEHLIIEYYSK